MNSNNKNNIDEYLLSSMDDLLGRYSVNESDDEVMNQFIEDADDKVIPTEFDGVYSIYYKGSTIKYIAFQSEAEKEILGYIKNSGDENAFLLAYEELLKESILLVKEDEPDQATVFKQGESKYTKVDFIIALDKDYSDTDVSNIIFGVYANDGFINGIVPENKWELAMESLR